MSTWCGWRVWRASAKGCSGGCGCFARYLGHYVRETGTWTLEEAVQHLAAHGAQRFGLRDRGLLRPGMAADVVVFDPDEIADRSTDLPHMLPSPDAFAAAAGALGLRRDAAIVVYDAQGLFSAPRVWWTLRLVFGLVPIVAGV